MRNEAPVIGVTPCERLDDYLAAVREAGGEPRVLDAAAPPDRALAGLDGLLLTGGLDVEPARYGQARHERTDVDRQRDDFEIPLARAAVARDLPVLAICRGVQVLNVALDGTLVQDIPSALPASQPHAVDTPKDALAHDVTIEPGSRLAGALGVAGPTTLLVNSRHHQSVDRPAPGVRVSAVAPDGVVEAIERPDARFCIGVQWHPENFWRTGEFGKLFASFLEACRPTT